MGTNIFVHGVHTSDHVVNICAVKLTVCTFVCENITLNMKIGNNFIQLVNNLLHCVYSEEQTTSSVNSGSSFL